MSHIARFTMFAAAAALAVAPAQARAQRDRDHDRDRTRIDSTFAFEKGSWVDVSIASGEIVIIG